MQRSGTRGEIIASRAIQDAGYEAHDANVLFRQHCPNIDLVVYGRRHAVYVQVKRDCRKFGGVVPSRV